MDQQKGNNRRFTALALLHIFIKEISDMTTQLAIACSELTIEILEQGAKYVQS